MKQVVLKTYKSYTQANRYTIYCQLSQNRTSVKKVLSTICCCCCCQYLCFEVDHTSSHPWTWVCFSRAVIWYMLHLFDLFLVPCSLAAVGIKARMQFILFSVLVTLVQQVTGQGHTQAHICLKIMQEHKGHIWYPGYIPRLWGGDISKTPSAKQRNYELSFNKCSAWYSFLLNVLLVLISSWSSEIYTD